LRYRQGSITPTLSNHFNLINEESLDEWLSEADENDPIRHVFLKCKIHDAYKRTI
jgi:hypothetical protein